MCPKNSTKNPVLLWKTPKSISYIIKEVMQNFTSCKPICSTLSKFHYIISEKKRSSDVCIYKSMKNCWETPLKMEQRSEVPLLIRTAQVFGWHLSLSRLRHKPYQGQFTFFKLLRSITPKQIWLVFEFSWDTIEF